MSAVSHMVLPMFFALSGFLVAGSREFVSEGFLESSSIDQDVKSQAVRWPTKIVPLNRSRRRIDCIVVCQPISAAVKT